MPARSRLLWALVVCGCEAESAPSQDPPAPVAMPESQAAPAVREAEPSEAPKAQPREVKPEPAAEPAAEPIAAKPLPATGKAGPAYLAVQNKGVVVLDGGVFKPLDGSPKTLVRQMTLGRDGKAYLLGFDGIMSLEGTSTKMIARTSHDVTGTVERVSTTPQGALWIAGAQKFGTWTGAAWKMQRIDVLGEPSDGRSITGLACDDEGGVWLATSEGLHHRGPEDSTFAAIDVSKHADGALQGIARGLDAASMTAWTARGLLAIRGTTAEAFSAGQTLAAPRGDLFVAHNRIGVWEGSSHTITRLHAGGEPRTYTLSEDFEGTQITALSVDGAGRTWVATDTSVTVMGPDDERARWSMGAVPAIAGRVVGIVVQGSGPALPEVGEPATSGLQGTIYVDDAPLAGGKVQVCPAPSRSIKRSPCEDSPIKFEGRTDSRGTFSFANVPLGAYGLGVKVGDSWKITFAAQYGAAMAVEQPYDIGKLKFRTSEAKDVEEQDVPKSQDVPRD